MARRRPRFVAILGSKKSGKTKLAAFLVRRLTWDGVRVAAVKHVHHRGFTMDTPGKDSWRLTKAGSRTVVVVSPDELGQITRLPAGGVRNRFKLALAKALETKPEVVVVEGFAAALKGLSSPFLIIVMAKNPKDLEKTLSRVDGHVLAISGKIAERGAKAYGEIPIIKFPRNAKRLVTLVTQRSSRRLQVV
jgi:molybdopterin-guanine dinucleotide biosynthesis protein MobB